MAQVEQELAKVQDMKPQLDQLAKSQEILKEEKEQLELANQQNEEKSRVLEEKLSVVEQTKDQVDKLFLLLLSISFVLQIYFLQNQTAYLQML